MKKNITKHRELKTKLILTLYDKIIEVIALFLVIGIWGFTLINYFELPQTIPIHYNIIGEADKFGNKITLLALPIILTVLYIGLTIINRYPHLFNYPTEITKENILRQYTKAIQMIRAIKLVIIIIFWLIIIKTVQSVDKNYDGYNVWILLLVISLIFIPIIYFFINSKNTKTDK